MSRNIGRYYLYVSLMSSRFSRGVLMLYSLSLGLSVLEFGLLQALYNLIRMVAEVPTGLIADRFNKKTVLSCASGLSALACLGLWAAAFLPPSLSFWLLALLFSLDSFATVLSSGADQALLFEELQDHKQDNLYLKVLSNAQILTLFVLSLATTLGGNLYKSFYIAIFILEAICFAAASSCIAYFDSPSTDNRPLVQEKATSIKEQLTIASQTFKTKPLLFTLISFITLLEVFLNALVRFIQGAFAATGMSPNTIATIIGLTTFCGVIGAYLSRFVAKIPLFLFLGFISGLFLLSSLALSSMLPTLMVVGFALMNILLDLSFPLVSQYVNQQITSDVRSTILSVHSSLVGLISIFFLPLMGLLLDHLSYGFSLLILGTFFSFFLFLFTKLSQRFSKTEEI
ncbi:MFS transporter [Streptococcus merionis]|uniref:MFS transporter n=1 Tax=Streptococcus merionis TaxID=400065 RepID=UPI0026F0A337|nr:MFS transporter [Streptococcus merionis]